MFGPLLLAIVATKLKSALNFTTSSPYTPLPAAEAHIGGPPAQPAADTRCKLLLLLRRQLLLPSQRRMMTNRHSRKNEVMKNTHSPKIRLDDIHLGIHPPLLYRKNIVITISLFGRVDLISLGWKCTSFPIILFSSLHTFLTLWKIVGVIICTLEYVMA